MKHKKVFAVIISFALILAMALPGTLAVSADQDTAGSEFTVANEPVTPTPETTPDATPAPEVSPEETKECTCDPKPSEGEAHKEGCPLHVAPEQPTEEEKVCTCDPTPADGEAHLEGCPLYVKPTEENPFKELYDKLMAAASMVEFTEICAAYTDDDLEQFEKWVVENEMLDSLQSHINVISPAPTMPETVVFTDAGPFMPPVEVADSGSGN